ncbi:hypothetical protein KR018_006931, partial [Drosophila ironensis]
LSNLLELEQKFISNLRAYTDKLTKKINTLQTFLNSIDYGVNQSLEEREKFVSNPLNAFALMRRTHHDLPKWHNYIQEVVGTEELRALQDIVDQAPKKNDMKDVLEEMQRLEEVYDLKATDLAKSRLHDKKYHIQLSIRDCVALGDYKMKIKDYSRASMWYRMALNNKPENHGDIINTILGNPLNGVGLKFAKSLLTYAIMSSNPTESMKQAEALADESIKKSDYSDLKTLITDMLTISDEEIDRQMTESRPAPTNYEMGCRGLYPKRKDLFCKYNSERTPFLKIAPLKEETISQDPYIAMFHEVLYGDEIFKLKQQVNTSSSVRKKVYQRIKDMTGLVYSIKDPIKWTNFGVQNQGEFHFKYTLNSRGPVGAIMFFASDDLLGGATIFPALNISIFPKKGSSLIWSSVNENGNYDPRMEHSICPVLKGN